MTTTAAAWWTALDNGQTACALCPIGCRLRAGQVGPCGTRVNRDGRLEPLYYGEIVSAGVDPVEKKPLYHYHPGRPILSVAAPGCNLHCAFCQNWTISQQHRAPTRSAASADVVDLARQEGSFGIAYTYSEPLVWYEFVRDTGRLAAAAGLKNVLVTNGFINPDPLAELLTVIHAANVDLKSMDDRFYRRVCKGRLEPVLATIRALHAAGVHVEITNLLIPGYNDSDEQIGRLVDFVAGVSADVPLHFSAYHPAWKLDAPPTPLATLLRARELATARLHWVYLGNVQTDAGRDSRCPACGETVVARRGYRAVVNLDAAGACGRCGQALPFVLD